MDPIDVRHDFETLETAVLLGVSRWKLARMIKRFELRDLVTTMRSDGEPVTRTPVGDGAPERAQRGHDG